MAWGSEWVVVRPDAVRVWRDPEVRRRLGWYMRVMLREAPAKFHLARRYPVDLQPYEDPWSLSTEELWSIHDHAVEGFRRMWRRVRDGDAEYGELNAPRERSLLAVKAVLAHRLASPCFLCERRCGVERRRGRIGACRVDYGVYVHAAFLHLGEEAPLVPSGTIFYGGCNFSCVFCQNHDISQDAPRSGLRVDAVRLAGIQDALARKGARNINHVGGDPTPSLHVIMESLLYVEENIPQLWNSNFYMTREAMELLVDVIDIWLPDFKYGNDKCAFRLSTVPNYTRVVKRNLKMAVEHGDMIIRHLVLPNHLECCTKPILEWIARELPRDRIFVNVMGQYTPMHRVARRPRLWPEIARAPTSSEIREAREYATSLGIAWEQVS